MRKKGLTFCLLLALLLCAAPALAQNVRFGVVEGANTVNLRAAASSSSAWLGAYPEGTWVEVLAERGRFYYVSLPDRQGYMSKDYVHISADAKGTIGVVTGGALNLRQQPSMNAPILAQYDEGTPCILLNRTGAWYHVSVDGALGYFLAAYIRPQYTTYSEELATVIVPDRTSVRLRSGPGTNYEIQRNVPHGRCVMVLLRGSGWWKVAVDGSVGFIDSGFLREGIVRDVKGGAAPYAIVCNARAQERLHLRQAPSVSAKSLANYANGTVVTVLAQGTQWCQVRTAEGFTGYMMTDYLTLRNLPETPTLRVVHPAGSAVNLRKSASTSTGRVIARVSSGELVTVLIPGGAWVKVSYGGDTGYMMAQFLQ